MEAEKLLETKRIVKRAMRGFMPDEKTRAWRAIENCMRLQELQQEIAENETQLTELGEGSYTPDLLVITDNSMTKAERDLLNGIIRVLGIDDRDVYFTQETNYTDEEVKILKPVVVINFSPSLGPSDYFLGKICGDIPYLLTHGLRDMLPENPSFKDVKTEVWTSLKELMKVYDQTKEEKGS